jgi:hypothetical protein
VFGSPSWASFVICRIKIRRILLVFASQGSIGSFLALSFNERINSKANRKAIKGSASLDPTEVNLPVVLSKNRSFMPIMRGRYHEVSGHHFKITAITLADSTVVEADFIHWAYEHRSALRSTSRFGFAGLPNALNLELNPLRLFEVSLSLSLRGVLC